MKDSGVEWIGEIPEEWEIVKFKNLFSFGRGLPITKADLLESGLPVINYGQIHSKQNDGVNLTDNLIRFVSPLFLENDASSLLNNGDFVFADTSEDVEGIGNAILVKHDEPIFAGYHTVICRPKFSGISRYFAYLFTTDLWRDQLRQLASGIKVFSITQTILSKVLLLIPPKEIQQKISAYLDRKCAQIDATLATIQQSIEKLKEYRQAVITRAVTKGLDPDARMKDSGVIYIDKIFHKFVIQRLKNLLLTPLQYGANESGIPYSEGLPRYIRITDIDLEGNLIDSNKQSLTIDQAENYLLKDGDILFARSGATVGKTFMFKEDMGKSCFAGYLIKATLKNSILPKLLYYFTQSTCYEDWKKFIFSQSTIQNINAEKYSSIFVPVPQLEDQKNIVAYLDQKCAQIDALISEKQKLHDKITAYKKSLIYEYVTGKREVPDGSSE